MRRWGGVYRGLADFFGNNTVYNLAFGAAGSCNRRMEREAHPAGAVSVFQIHDNSRQGKRKEKEEKPTEEKPKNPKKKHTPEEIIDGFIDAVHRYGPGAKQILRNIRVHRLEGYWQIAAEDAAACAIRYGRICALLNTAFGFLRNLVKIEKTKLRVYPDFIAEKEEIRVLADIEANPLVAIIGALRIAFAFLSNIIKEQKKETSKKERT